MAPTANQPTMLRTPTKDPRTQPTPLSSRTASMLNIRQPGTDRCADSDIIEGESRTSIAHGLAHGLTVLAPEVWTLKVVCSEVPRGDGATPDRAPAASQVPVLGFVAHCRCYRP